MLISTDHIFRTEFSDMKGFSEFSLSDCSQDNVIYMEDISIKLEGGTLILKDYALPDDGLEWVTLGYVCLTEHNWVDDV